MGGYTGPTSGRITVGPEGVTHRESFTDEPLTADERKATEWFRALSPHEQYREVCRMKWNLAEAKRRAEEWKTVAARQDRELRLLGAKLAAITPEGFILPKAAADLFGHAEAHGWKTARTWRVDGDTAALYIALGNAEGWRFEIPYGCDRGGGGRRTRAGIARSPSKPWHDAPSLTRIKEIIKEAGNAGQAQ